MTSTGILKDVLRIVSASGMCRNQALKSLNAVETQLIIYPGQHHGLTTPSYVRYRLEKWVGWYDKFLKK
jgi:hypothetical protein